LLNVLLSPHFQSLQFLVIAFRLKYLSICNKILNGCLLLILNGFFFRAVIGLFVALLVLGTAFDVITRQMSKSKSRKEADIYQNGGTQWKTTMGKSNEGYEADDTVKENGSVDYKYRVSGETELPSFEETKDHTEPYKPGDTKG